MRGLSKLVKAAMKLLLSDSESTKSGARTITRSDARKILDAESDKIEARIKCLLSSA